MSSAFGTKARNISEYIEHVIQHFRRTNAEQPLMSRAAVWYRGHRNRSGQVWQLLPVFYREPRWKALSLADEDAIYLDFRLYAQHLAVEKPDYVDDWAWWALMRHHGGPTRLLDWTESPLMALYFAVNDSRTEAGEWDATVWLLDPLALNEKSWGHRELIFPARGDESIVGADPPGEQFTSYYLPGCLESKEKEPLPELPVAVSPPQLSRRMQAQRGFFTVHGLDNRPIEDLVSDLPEGCLQRIEIEGSAVEQMRRDLQVLLVETDVFPDLDHLAGRVVREWSSRPDGEPV